MYSTLFSLHQSIAICFNASLLYSYHSSSPQVEDLITLQVEDALGTVKHVETIESTSTDVSSEVSLEFKLGTDMDLVTLEVRDKIEQIRNKLPEEVGNIRILRFDYVYNIDAGNYAHNLFFNR